MSKYKILVQITGSIAAYKVCDLISKLSQADYEVKVAVSKNALNFVGAATLEGLSGSPVYSDLWQDGRMMDHIELNRWADLIIVAPASANYINSVASGLGDGLLTTLFLAHDFKKPFLIAPAMNQAMYLHPVTQKSLKALANMGIVVLSPANGLLACGEVGPGRLMESEQIFQNIEQKISLLRQQKTAGKILITAGGTCEAIDDVRCITNLSTGATGATIADDLTKNGFDVTYLSAELAQKPSLPCRQISFKSFQDLQMNLHRELQQNYSAVIHAAAVSDYSPIPQNGKISSQAETLQLELKKNPKLINQVRDWSVNKKLKLIAFKLTSTEILADRELAVKKLAQDSGADLIIQNDFKDFELDKIQHPFVAYKNNQLFFDAEDKKDLAQKLSKYLQEIRI